MNGLMYTFKGMLLEHDVIDVKQSLFTQLHIIRVVRPHLAFRGKRLYFDRLTKFISS